MRSLAAVVVCLALGTTISSTSAARSLGWEPGQSLDLSATYGSSMTQWLASDFRLSLGNLCLPAQDLSSIAISPGSISDGSLKGLFDLSNLTSRVAGTNVIKLSFSDILRAGGLGSLTIDGLKMDWLGGATVGVLAPIPEPSSRLLYLIAAAGAALVCGTRTGRKLLGHGVR